METLWDIPKNKEKQIFNWFMTRPKHLKQRVITTVQEGVNKFGLKPKTLDAAKLYRYYNDNITTSMANIQFLKGVTKLRSSNNTPLVMRADKAPDGWKEIDNPVLRRAKGIKVSGGGEEKILLNKINVKVHPEIEDEMKAVFSGRVGGETVKAVEGINAFIKHSQLSLSLFHGVALTESAIANGIFDPKLMGRVIKSIKQGKRPIINDPMAQDAIKHGVKLGASSDVQRGLVESGLLAAEENLKKNLLGRIPAVGVKAVRKAVEYNNKFLWDYYHPNLKLYAYEKLVQDALKMKRFQGIASGDIKKEVGQFVNDSFGGQAWDLMAKSAQWQQGMHALLLSPDWAVSSIRQALAPFEIGARKKITAGLRAELGQNFWKAAGLVVFTGINNLNRSFSKFYLGENRDMWENDPGHETHLFIGYNPDGSKKWLRWGKQFRELPEFFIKDGEFKPLGAPIKKITGKLSPIPQIFLEQAKPFPHGELGKAIGTRRETTERLKTLARVPLPFSVRQATRRPGDLSPLALAFPTSGSRGSVYFNSITQMEQAIEDKNISRAKKIFDAAVENGLNGDAILKRANSNVDNRVNQSKKDSEQVFIELLRIPKDQWRDHIRNSNLDERETKRLGRIVKERLKAEQLNKEIVQKGITPERIKQLLQR
jgi:hypothetical protein